MRIRINPVQDPQLFEQVTPNFIYNRFDLFCKEGEFCAVSIQSRDTVRIVEYRIQADQAELGLWLTPITREELEALLMYISQTHPGVRYVSYNNGVLPYGSAREHNHFRIVFPATAEEMKARATAKSWSKMRRRNRRAEEIYGPMQLLEYTRENIPLEIVEAFFQYKLETRNRIYNLTAQEYLDRYHVTDCYVVKFGDTIGAMHFLCEQCPVVNGENHSYNPELQEYSLGKFIFAHSLIRLVEKKHTEIFLAGGDYEYKTHYGSIEDTLYDCKIDLNKVIPDLKNQKSISRKLQRSLKRLLPSPLVTFLHKVKHFLKRKLR